MKNIWNHEEVGLLHSELSNEEIAGLTGRTIEAVKTKRFHMTGHYVEKDKARYNSTRKVVAQEEKEIRLYKLAKKLGVKIGG